MWAEYDMEEDGPSSKNLTRGSLSSDSNPTSCGMAERNKPLLVRALRVICCLCLLVMEAHAQSSQSAVVLISFDGFRHDYIDRYQLKNFQKLRADGASAKGLVPCFPSLTYPNHYAIVTGMRPSTNGLVDNTFYDSLYQITYTLSDRSTVHDARFYGGTPLWTLARQSGVRSASYFWPATEVTDDSRRPDISYLYDSKVTYRARVDSTISWLANGVRFVSLYFDEPDHTSHNTGPNSRETRDVLLKMDSVLGYFMMRVGRLKVPVNTVVVSDHGMSELPVRDDTFIFLDELYDVKTDRFKTVMSSSLAHLYFDHAGTLDSMYTILKRKENHYRVYKRSELPKGYYYNHYRVGDLVILAAPYHTLRLEDRERARKSWSTLFIGVHGFDPDVVSDVHGIFIASGPQVKKGVRLGLVRNIDVYPLIATLLGLPIPQIDGDANKLQGVYVGKKN